MLKVALSCAVFVASGVLAEEAAPGEYARSNCPGDYAWLSKSDPDAAALSYLDKGCKELAPELRSKTYDLSATPAKKPKQKVKPVLPNPHIGMSADDVLHRSSWGKPERINTTVTARGTKEQWVYGLRNYLYFENGYLVSSQSSR